MRVVSGDLLSLALEGHFDVIVHGCNCFCTMGAGIAKQIRHRFPEAWEVDQATVAGDRAKLGSLSWATVERTGRRFIVVNAYTQFDWRGTGLKADYAAIATAMHRIKQQFGGARIGYPKMGAGLAGGDWCVISALIDEALTGERHTLVEFESPAPRPCPGEDEDEAPRHKHGQ